MGRTGYIKVYRSLLEWEWHDNPNVLTIWIHLLLNARYMPGEYRGRLLSPGQLITGREKLARETGLSPDQVRTALRHLQRSGAIQIESSNRYSVVTVVNWECYQNKEGHSPAEYPASYSEQMQECQGVSEREEGAVPNNSPDKSPANHQQIPSGFPNKSPHKKKDKKEEGEKEITTMMDRPFDLSSGELQLMRKRDEVIEATARSNGIPFHEAGMLTARELSSSYGLEALLEAIRIAGRGRAQTWAYVEGILKRKVTREQYRRGSMQAELQLQSSSPQEENPYAEYLGTND